MSFDGRAKPAVIDARHERCICNRLVCVIRGNNIEIKCGKCKRVVTIKTSGITGISFKIIPLSFVMNAI